ncbi:MAG: DUF2235 domain-containing protein [Pseudomonadota bacterium]
MTNLVICCDGTWNTPEQEDQGRPAPTNVFKLHGAINEPEINRYYREGVGTSGGLWSRLKGGGLGVGLSNDIKSAYRWLCNNYSSGDSRIFLFGFSRGAYAVRSLAGLVGQIGILDFADVQSEDEKWAQVEQAYQAYRTSHKRRRVTSSNLKRHTGVEIAFLGVWDTVGALGIPDELPFNILDRPQRFQFHDTKLGPHVKVARHALAIDERRQAFSPTLWSSHAISQDVKQEWFAGVHGDVGGSYAESGLGDVTLDWMIKEAQAQGLAFKPYAVSQVSPDPAGILHNSVKGFYAKLRTRPRSVPGMDAPFVHPSARERAKSPPLAQPSYWTTVQLAAGESTQVDVFAAERWNETSLYLEKDVQYRFAAKGEWLDGTVRCTPNGPVPGFNPSKLIFGASAISDWLQQRKRNRSGNLGAITVGARREQDKPWLSLIGVVANGVGVDPASQILNPHETFKIGTGTSYTPKESGYLYCFGNDVWSFYFNNRGSLRLRVERE